MDHEYSLLIDQAGSQDEIDNLYLFNLYYYFHHRGYSNLILKDITNVLVLIFTVGFLTFTVQCVDFSGLISYDLKEETSLWNYVHWDQYWHFSPFLWICYVLFVAYIIIQIISIYASSRKFWEIRRIYREAFDIESKALSSLDWNQVMNKIISYHTEPNLNCYTFTLRIMAKENLMITLYDGLKKLNFHKYPLTKLLEWNLLFCFLDPLVNEKREIDKKYQENPQLYLNGIKKRLTWVSIINVIFMPFILLFIILYVILQYGEQFYSNPDLIMNRQWSLKATWKLRYYNELPHSFLDRMNKAAIETRNYSRQFPSRLAETTARFFMYVLGSIFLIFLVLTLMNENLLINLNISSNRPILWYMGIIGALIALAKTFIHKPILPDPEKALEKMEKHIEIDQVWKDDPKSIRTRDSILSLFPQRAVLLFQECLFIIATPYILYFVLREESDTIGQYLLDHLTTNYSVPGLVSKYSLFNNTHQINQNSKTARSFKNFTKHYPEWDLNSFFYNVEESTYPDRSLVTDSMNLGERSTDTLIDMSTGGENTVNDIF